MDARIFSFAVTGDQRILLVAVAILSTLGFVVPAYGQLIAGEVTVFDPYGGWYPDYYPGPCIERWPIILPPLYLPAETLYGPSAVQRFMGVNVPYNSPRITIVANRQVPEAPPPIKPKPRASNAAARARADRFVQFGDAQFGKQRYHSAAERYKSAVEAAPELPDSFFRQGFALVAMGKYDAAARAMRRGLLLEPDLSPPNFVLDELYQANRAAKVAHLEALSQAIEAAPHTADLLLVLGVMLQFDGQADRALPLFTRCAQLGGNEDGALDRLLAK